MTVPNWKIERYLLEELPESEMAALKILDKESGEFHSQVELLKSSNAELLAKYPAKAVTEKMFAKASKFSVIEGRLPLLAACAALLLCATVLLSVLGGESAPQNIVVMSEDGTRVKGLKTGLEIWRKTADSAEQLSNNSLARAGDLLQIRYAVAEQCYGVLLSVDGNGVLTIHLVGEHGKAAQLEAGRVISLANAYELDNAQKFEKFYLITNTKEFSLAPIAETILQGKLPKNLNVDSVTLLKK